MSNLKPDPGSVPVVIAGRAEASVNGGAHE